MNVDFCEMSMVLLIQQNDDLRKEFAKFGYDSSDESIEQMKMLINNNFLNHKCKAALIKMFKKHVDGQSGYLATMYSQFDLHYREHQPVDGKRFYVWQIDEVNGEYEYTHKGVAELDENEDPEEWLENYTSDFYSGGEKDEDEDCYWFNGEITCESGGITEISKDEYSIVAKYI